MSTVLGFFHLTPSIRHAVLAVSSLHESLIYDGWSLGKKLANKQIFALQQYNKAISIFQRQDSHKNDNEPIVPLLLCILFHIAPIYMRSGLTSYLFGIDTVAVPKMVNSSLDLPAVFSSIQQARHAFYSILDDSLRWRFVYKSSQHLDPRIPTDFAYQTANINKTPPTPQDIRAFELEQQTLLSRLSKWHTAFSLFKSTSSEESPSTPSMLLLQILYHTSTIWTSTAISKNETDFDEHTERFGVLIPLCADYLAATKLGSRVAKDELSHEHKLRQPKGPVLEKRQRNTHPQESNLVFTFETGIVPTLFLIAAKCRHPKIRRAAISLLLTDEERHENLWKAKCFASIATRFVDIETKSAEEYRWRSVKQPFTPVGIVKNFCQLPQDSDSTIKDSCTRQETDSSDVQTYVLPTPTCANRSPKELQSTNHVFSAECCPINTCGRLNSHHRQAVNIIQNTYPGFLNNSGSLNSVRSNLCGLHTELNTMRGTSPLTARSPPMTHLNVLHIRHIPPRPETEPEPGQFTSPPVWECLDPPFGLPEELRISEAIIGQHEKKGMPVTFFRKPNQLRNKWEIWKEFILFD
ncbi:unnamed protein product [Clonostachys chloroleuca]|uniref:Uncharacterized protein n=1 Tax=Clonostachys chloroleuca TaxID=1926264 RepID=A0AA35M6M2_9HYPO|nr:unnamed protein product [Clonostachys chloroleuca]